jgi:CheY-like chemotaxis protein
MLVVDDNATNRRILHYQLTNWGITHQAVATGSEALALLRGAAKVGKPYDLLILDHHMPEMDGVMLAAGVRADAAIARTPMVMMTSLGHYDANILREAGIAVRLIKPVKQAQLRETLARVLEHAHAPGASLLDTPEEPLDAVALPLSQSTPVAEAMAERRARILVAEDNPVNQRVILLQLRQLGYAADAVGNGHEALAALAREPYDIVLMDCQMPELDGYQATQEIRAREAGTARTPIIAMTAHALAGDRDKCLAAGMDDYVSKPVKTAALADVLMRWDTVRAS